MERNKYSVVLEKGDQTVGVYDNYKEAKEYLNTLQERAYMIVENIKKL